MNRHDRRAALKEQRQYVGKLPRQLTEIPPEEWPVLDLLPVQAWRSRDYLVLLYDESGNADYPGMMRLSVCRTEHNGYSWKDGLSWDELQAIKHKIGLGSVYAVEVYPPDGQVVNVANFRHLWLMKTPLNIGFGVSQERG